MKERRERGAFSFAFAAIFNGLMLVIINAHAIWRPWLGGIVTADWVNVLWIANVAGAVQVTGNLLLVVARPVALQRLFQLIFAGFSFAGSVVFFQVFPFDFSRVGEWATLLVRGALIVGIAGSLLAIAVNFFKLALGGPPRPKPVHP